MNEFELWQQNLKILKASGERQEVTHMGIGTKGSQRSHRARPAQVTDCPNLHAYTPGIPIPPFMEQPPVPQPPAIGPDGKPKPILPPTARDLTAHLPEADRPAAMAKIR